MASVFISYRRQDTGWAARNLSDRLCKHFGSDCVFMDVDAIQPGDDFVEVLENAVGQCDVLLALIGPQWNDIRDEQNRRRLDDSHDFVRLEIAIALRRRIRLIPILVDEASMPRADELPQDMMKLSRRQALEIRPKSVHRDVEKLVEVIRRVFEASGEAKDGEGSDSVSGEHPVSSELVNGTAVIAPEDGSGTGGEVHAAAEIPMSTRMRVALRVADATRKMTNWTFTSTIHLWIGLTYIEEGLVSRALRKQGIDPATARRTLRNAISNDEPLGEDDEGGNSENVERAVDSARQYAARQGEAHVHERHLLAALWDYSESSAVLLTQILGVDVEELKRSVRQEAGIIDNGGDTAGVKAETEEPLSAVDWTKVVTEDGGLREGGKGDESDASLRAASHAVPGLEDAMREVEEHADLPMSPDALVALLGAATARKMTNWSFITSMHLWIGLTYIDDGLLATALRKQGLDPQAARRTLRSAIRKDDPPSEEEEGSVSESVERALESALQFAACDGDPQVQERHLLAAILACSDSSAFELTQMLGVDVDQLKRSARPEGGTSDTRTDRGDTRGVEPGTKEILPVSETTDVVAQDGTLRMELFDTDSQVSLQAACQSAAETHRDKIEGVQLLLGIVRSGGKMWNELETQGFNVSRLNRELRRTAPRRPASSTGPPTLHRDFLSEDALCALQAALKLAAKRTPPEITERLLFEAVTDQCASAAAVLRRLGIYLAPESGHEHEA